MWLIHSTYVLLYLSIFPEHTDTFVTSWQQFTNSVFGGQKARAFAAIHG